MMSRAERMLRKQIAGEINLAIKRFQASEEVAGHKSSPELINGMHLAAVIVELGGMGTP
jgi:hypothetical protein